MPDTTLHSSAGLETGKAWHCRGEQENVKGAFFGRGVGQKEIQIHLKNNFFCGREELRTSTQNKGALLVCGTNTKQNGTCFLGALLYGGDRLQLGEGKMTQEGRGILNYGKSRNLRKRLNLFLTVISTAS